ncbi:hypothetical protein EA772_07350 [Pedobacter sp. G11]|uniref:Wzz/FepE/Etk N-terminal domain-containing protein n=1 Tax=Pedobacter sp. G11 TaxID=2482728 RepID=UPI000F5E5E8B|nr:Wzz/FepE/Etk N-terminal domain-containing protein [Pedobacter sp. G11]AZI25172.1 hypothetical protein EA772_07350 [Pedobacter sp. G11]
MNKVQQNSDQYIVASEETINLKSIFDKLVSSWHWLTIFTFTGLLAAYIYVNYTSPLYQINAKLLVNDDDKGGSINKQASALMDLGSLMGGKSSVDNEAEVLKTRFLMAQVVRDMELNVTYFNKMQLMTQEVYQAPIKIIINKELDTIKNTNLEITKISASQLSVKGKKFEKKVTWGQTFFVKNIGAISIMPTDKLLTDKTIFVNICSIDDRVAALMKQFNVGVANKQVSVIDLGLIYPLPKKGEDILNKLIFQYVATNLSDKNAIADSTSKFIKERINRIASELGDVENDVESFKQKNQLADMTEQGKVLVQNTGSFPHS